MEINIIGYFWNFLLYCMIECKIYIFIIFYIIKKKKNAGYINLICFMSLREVIEHGNTVIVQEVRAHLYSMWSGSDLTFMKLPESSEPNDTIQATDITTTSSSTSSGDAPQKLSQLDTAHTYYSSSK